MVCNCSLFAQIDLNAGLAAYYPFNGNANDESGFNHHPVFNNATLTEDRFGIPNSAYYFNGVDNYMRIADTPDLNFNDRISIAVWVKPMGFYYGPCHGNSVLIKGADTDPTGRYTIRFTDYLYLNGANCSIATPDTLHQNYWGSGIASPGGYTPYVEKDKWVSVVYTYDGINAKIYVDCQLVNSTQSPGLTFTSPYDLFLGKLDAPTHPYWYNGAMDDIRLYNRALTEDEIRFIASDGQVVHTPLQTVVLPTGGSVKIGTSNLSPTYQWFPSGPDEDSITVNNDGLYIVETDVNGCSNRDSFRVVFVRADFSFKQDVCDPLHFIFKNETPTSTVIDWDFGNGSNAPADPNPATSYSATGSYTVTMHIVNNNGVNEVITKEIAIQIQPDSLIITHDTTICKDASLQLNAINALNYCWTPSAGLSATNIASPVATPAISTTYYLNALVTENDLILNGDFSSGNTGFTSEYSYVTNNNGEGQYFVGPAPATWNPQFTQICGDHTGNGNMLMVNGESTEDRIVWSQTIDISPNTNYAFSTWVQSLSIDNPTQLMFSINGNTIGNTISAGLPICNWSQFYATWNSGDNTTAVIAIVNKNTGTGGNDFALDDIHFAPFSIKTDSIVIAVEEPRITAFTDTTICEGSFAQLGASGNFASYQWTPANGLSDAFISNPVASPGTDTEYIITGTTIHGCMDTDTVNILVLQTPAISLTDDTEICHNTSIQLHAAGGSTYTWWPAAGLSDPNTDNPVATPLANTTYVVEVEGFNNCVRRDSVTISIRPYPVFRASSDATICEGTSLQLSASGGDHYQWAPADYLSDPVVANPIANPPAGTTCTIYIRENVCSYDTVIDVRVNVNPTPVVSALRSNDINCSERTAQLTASGAVHYSWTPAQHLNYSNSPNPVAGIDTTTLFTVRGTNEYGCSSEDTVVVKVTTEGDPLFLMPNAFTPNNDGINDCFSLKKWGRIDLQEFSVYNRWGEKIFTTKNENDCWDGAYRGISQPSGTYVYVIRAKTFCGDIFRKGTVNLIR
ncbi:MAG: gliding motility-associated C-terminal domain-containing protein [Chitinophagaceae bacterium]|nr:gliding motility-associated C-terminal domain-containing protein [Chitinophagaceae bacterium]MCW5926248.1 gliding motility-associated C-terminal domain-containing protein [Chitinophagaceae bacterium]